MAEAPVKDSDEELKGLEVIDDSQEEEFPEDFPDYFPSGIVEYLAQKDATTILSKREDVRGRLAYLYTFATFGIFVLGFLVAILDAYLNQSSIIDNLTRLLPLISGIFLGTLGFVLGYYFRRVESEESENRSTQQPQNPQRTTT